MLNIKLYCTVIGCVIFLALPVNLFAAVPNLNHTSISCSLLDETDEDGETLENVIAAIREALTEAQENNVKGFPKLQKVEITLNTVAVGKIGAKINFLIFSIGAKKTYETTSTLKLQLEPPDTKDEAGLASTNADKLKTVLGKAITLAKGSIDKVDTISPLVKTSQVEIEFKFAVKRSAEAGGKVQILPVGIEGTGEIGKDKLHTIKLTFASKKKPS